MAEKLFSQSELNKIVSSRVKRERERLTKDFERRLKSCMASVHLTMFQEMCSLKRDTAVEMEDTYMSEEKN